jgi:Na+/H+-dicarboxylate symporter
MVLAILAGALARLWLPADGVVAQVLIDGAFDSLGQIFIRSLQLLVVPLVFVSLVCGTSSLTDIRQLGRIGVKTVSMYLLTTALAISLAISLGLLFDPGLGVALQAEAFEI